MQKFTKSEISWIISAIEKVANEYKREMLETTDREFVKLYQLRFEQYTDISERLRKALHELNKRIEIE